MSNDSSFAEYSVGGTTFAPVGSISTLEGKHAEKTEVRTNAVNKLVEICAVCNDAKIAYNSVSQLFDPEYSSSQKLSSSAGNRDLYQCCRANRGGIESTG